MPPVHSVGFPRMMKEAGEKRVFLPEFIQFFARLGLEVFIEEGYGSRSGFTFEDFHMAHLHVHMATREEVFQQELVIVLRSPTLEEYELLSPDSCLFSMLHFPTRPRRVDRLHRLGVRAISMDSVVNDSGLRLVENMHAVAWNGLEVAFDALEWRWPGLMREEGEPWRVLVIGSGMVGKLAADAGTKLGNLERNNIHIQQGGPGSLAVTVGRNLSCKPAEMQKLFSRSDVLVDAAYRRDSTRPVVPNEWIAWLPEHAIITDLAVDPYTLDTIPPVVRGVEGIPQGNLDKYIFSPEDPDWNHTVPGSIPSQERRTVVSCYSWPGIHPEACMRHYARQMEPLMEVLLVKGYDDLSLEGSFFERALYRATLKAFVQGKAEASGRGGRS